MSNTTIEARINLCLRLGDSALIIGHRLSEWCGHGPILEEDIAMTNIALDFVGLSRNLLSYAATIENKGRTEDDLAYLRDVTEYRNILLAEQPNGNFAQTMVRQFIYDAFSAHFYRALTKSADEQLRAIAEKATKEMDYHVRHSGDWIIRLGDGTEESKEKTQEAVNELWMFTGDMFDVDSSYKILLEAQMVPDILEIKTQWQQTVEQVMQEAGITIPSDTYMQKGSLLGMHTEHLGYLLAEMQFLQRAYPKSVW